MPKLKLTACFLLLCGALAGAMAPAPPARAQTSDEQALVEKARLTVESFARQSDMGDMRRKLARARGVFVVPQMLKAGFIIGGEGGSGVLLARNPESGEWSAPSFFTMGAGSIGLQIGAEASEVVLVIMTSRGLNAILRNEFKLGADASIAVGPIGKGVEAGTSATDLEADVFSYSRSQGLFGGVSLEGAVIKARHSWNQSYYGRAVTPREIVLGNAVSAGGAEALRRALRAAELR